MVLLRYIAARGGLFSILLDSIRVQDLCMGDELVYVEKCCSCSSRISYLLEDGLLRTLSVVI